MRFRTMSCLALLATLAPLGVAKAAPVSEVSAFALPIVSPQVLAVVPVPRDGVHEESGFAQPPPPDGRLESVRYRPRGERRPYHDSYYGPRTSTVSQLHAGFLDPDGDPSAEFLLGFRGGLLPDPHVQVGLGVDWTHKSEALTAVVSEGPGPGGQTITTRRELARSSSNFFPLMVYAQINADDNLPVIPYAGIAGAYEVIFLSAEDFTTGEKFDGTFDGFGWQAWAGAAIPLSGRARFTGEVFVNQAELSRDVDDPSGATFREIVDGDGVGMRFGFNWGF